MNFYSTVRNFPNSEFKHYYQDWCVDGPKDFDSDHVQIISWLASKCSSAVEFGVRRGVSSVSLAYGLSNSKSRNRSLASYDIAKPNFKWETFEAYCLDANVSVCFNMTNSRHSTIPKTDILFIDSFHSYSHFMEEVRLHESKASRFIIMHDSSATGKFGMVDQSDDGYPQLHDYTKHEKQGMHNAAIDFAKKYKRSWEVLYHSNKAEGLTVFITKNKELYFDAECLGSFRNIPGNEKLV